MKHLKAYESINTNSNGLLKIYREEAEIEIDTIYISKIKNCFENEYNFEFDASDLFVQDIGRNNLKCVINGIPMKIYRDSIIKFDFERMAKEGLKHLISVITNDRRTSGPEFQSVLEVVFYFEKNNISINANKNLKSLIKTGLFT
jgi:hypothetical protein